MKIYSGKEAAIKQEKNIVEIMYKKENTKKKKKKWTKIFKTQMEAVEYFNQFVKSLEGEGK